MEGLEGFAIFAEEVEYSGVIFLLEGIFELKEGFSEELKAGVGEVGVFGGDGLFGGKDEDG